MIDAPAVRPLDPGLLGQGVYESIRTYDRQVFALPEHLERLADGAARLGIPCPVAELAAEASEAAAARDGLGETRIRIYLTAGGTRIVVADSLPDRRVERERGIMVMTLPWPRDPDGPTAGIKASSTAAVRVAQRWLDPSGAQTGIWVTRAGHVSEALAANVFAVVGGVIVTPPLSDGALAGVTRAKLLVVARLEGLACEERSVPLDELRRADEAIVSATSEPVVPVVSLDGAPIAEGSPGPITRRLQQAFERYARAAPFSALS